MYSFKLSNLPFKPAFPKAKFSSFFVLCGLLLLLSWLWPQLLSPFISSPISSATIVEPILNTDPETPTEIHSSTDALQPSDSNPSQNSMSQQQSDPSQSPDSQKFAASEQGSKGPVRVPVLNYHSITLDPGNPATITPEKFQEQMNYLKENDYTTLTLQQFSDVLEGKLRAPAKSVLLTFDDGYADNYEHALPLLQKLDFHATLFMSPGMVEDGYYLNWDQIKEMHEAGWDIQPHGMTHPSLPRLKPADQAYQITEAKRQIEEQLGTTADIFCYPYGQWNASTLQLLKQHNFRYAFTIEQGWTTPEQDALKLKRVFVNGEESLKEWKSKLEKW